MSKAWESVQQATVPATAEEVWDAIATGPGIQSWFVGRHDVTPGPDGVVRMRMGGYTPDMPITVWDPPRHLAYRTEAGPDGRFEAYEFLVEARAGGSTVLRSVTSGFLPGDDWADEFEAMTYGGELFFGTLTEYLAHFAGRPATSVEAAGPPVADWDAAWAAVFAELGLPAAPVVGDKTADGVVFARSPHALGIRTPDALLRFLRGLHGPMLTGHKVFGPVDEAASQDWTAWLTRVTG